MIAEVRLPSPDSDSVGGFDSPSQKVKIIQQINHEGEVNIARYMPQNPSIVATKAVNSDIYVFDHSKHPSKPPQQGVCNPEIILKGHDAEGYGLSWSPFKEGYVLSGSYDAQICLWDISASAGSKVLEAKHILKVHEGVVEDVSWHLKHDYLFGSVGDDRCLLIWDMRAPMLDKPMQSIVAHQSEVNSLSFNPFNEWVLATGSADKTVKLFDLRKLSSSLHTCSHHTEEVIQVRWSPKMKQYWLPLVVIKDLWSGTSAELARSKHQKMQKMGHLSCFSFMEDILAKYLIFHGI